MDILNPYKSLDQSEAATNCLLNSATSFKSIAQMNADRLKNWVWSYIGNTGQFIIWKEMPSQVWKGAQAFRTLESLTAASNKIPATWQVAFAETFVAMGFLLEKAISFLLKLVIPTIKCARTPDSISLLRKFFGLVKLSSNISKDFLTLLLI